MKLKAKLQRRDSGSALIVGIFVMLVLLALSSADLAVMTKNLKQSNFYLARAKLRATAESGVSLAIHDLKHGPMAPQGVFGAEFWTTADDFGEDGTPNTGDPGEGDLTPTPGEPNVTPLAIQDTTDGVSFCTWVDSTGIVDVFRVACSATNGSDLVVVEKYVLQEPVTIPRAGAVVVPPDASINLSGNSFLIDGNDYGANGTLSLESGLQGLVTWADPDNPGANRDAVLDQVGPEFYNQINGDAIQANDPSVAEISGLDVPDLYETLYSMQNNTLEPGVHSSPDLGDYDLDEIKVTYVSGDVKLTGNATGSGVLIVDGSLTVTGDFQYQGLVIVKDGFKVSGGGSRAQILGSVMVGGSGGTIDTTFSGTVDLYYSDEVLDKVEQLALSANYSFLYYND